MVVTAWTFGVVCWWFGRRERSHLAAFATCPMLLAPTVYSAACLLRLDCAGRVAPAPLGVSFSGYSDLRVPIGLDEAAALTLALAVVARATRAASPWTALLALSLVEWSIEFGRIEHLTRATGGNAWLWLRLGRFARCR